MVKIIGISGSPRRSGNTEILLDAALEGAAFLGAVTEKVIVNELSLGPCLGCYRCVKNGTCVIKDDIHAIYKKLDDADGIIIASPIYFGSLTAQLKTMVDRFQPQWVRTHSSKKPLAKKKLRRGIFLCVSGDDKIKFFRNARSIVRYLFATLNIKYLGGLFAGGISEAGDINKRPRALKKAFNMGSELAAGLKR
ncbi:MAG: flavodoxin family protein [Candidatus Omnitrophota bacterium]